MIGTPIKKPLHFAQKINKNEVIKKIRGGTAITKVQAGWENE